MSTSKVNLVIFSKDRACQLDLLLRSIYKLGWHEVIQPWVIYAASTPDYYKAYSQCFIESPFVEPYYQPLEINLQLITKSLMRGFTGFTGFSTDDMVFFRKPEKNLLEILNDLPANGCFSLRLGYNTVIQDYHRQSRQPALNLHVVQDGVLKWNPHHYPAYANYGYPLALDTHIFHTAKIRDLANKFAWKSTNELESGLQAYRHEVTEMWSYQHSVSVNIPANNMSGITKAGEKYTYGVDELNKRYLAGERINLSTILAENVVGCHQEMELDFVQV